MKQFFAILCDSFREAIDRKLFIVLLFLTSIPIIFCWGISFEREPLEKTLNNLAVRLNSFQGRPHGPPRRRIMGRPQLHVSIGGVKPVDNGKNWPSELRGGHVLDLTFTKPEELNQVIQAVKNLFSISRKPALGKKFQVRETNNDEKIIKPPDMEDKIKFLKDRFNRFGFNHVCIRQVEKDEDHFLIAVKGDYPHEILGAHKLNLIFGVFSGLPLYKSGMSIAEFTIALQKGLSDIFAGLIVMVIAILSTASFIPNMLQKGTVDLLLARPVNRIKLLLFKYLGGLWFILLFSSLLTVGCWIAISVRTGFWNPWFLFSIVTISIIFAVLYSISLLMGVLTRSNGISALSALGVWVLSSVIVNAHHMIKMLIFGADVPPGLVKSLDICYAILPKIKDISLLNTYALSKSHLSKGLFDRIFAQKIPEIDWFYSLGTTALFTACMLGLAAWIFNRRDY